MGVEAKEKHDDSSDSDEHDSNIYEPGLDLEVEQNPIFNENHFLPSVGIVMSGNCQNDDSSPEMLANKDSLAKNASDVSAVSITSVTDHIQMPRRMLECASPIKNRSPTPEIRINQEQSGSGSSLSSNEMRHVGPGPNRDLSLNLSGSQSENALKQLNKLASPLTKLAKGVQNLGANLDPRKMTGKVNFFFE